MFGAFRRKVALLFTHMGLKAAAFMAAFTVALAVPLGIATGTLAGCACPSCAPFVLPETANTASLLPQDWYILYANQMPVHPSATTAGAWSFDFPQDPGYVSYVVVPYQVQGSLPTEVTITFEVVSSHPGYAAVDPTETAPDHFHLFFDQSGDNYTEDDATYRWWALTGVYQLGSNDNQTITITVPLTYTNWEDVNGQKNQAAFQNALQNVAWVGITFGGSMYCGHGVQLEGGSATFVLKNFVVK